MSFVPPYEPKVDTISHGQIASMDPGADWVEAPPEAYKGIGMQSTRTFHNKDYPTAKILLHYRGFPLENNSAGLLWLLLEKAPHMVTPSEWKSIAEVLGFQADESNFRTLIARTEDLNGKRVLIVEGRFIAENLDVTTIYVDAVGSGRYVQEISYEAPREIYPCCLREAKSVFRTIEWR